MADLLGQRETELMLTPCVVGWGLQLILCGSATTMGLTLLQKKATTIQKFGRTALYMAIVGNLAASAVNIVEIWHYSTMQNRTVAGLQSFHSSDCLATLFPGIVALITQAFLSMRCYRLSSTYRAYRRWLVASILTCGCFVSFGASIFTSVSSFLWIGGADPGYFNLIFPGYQLILWSNFVTDLLICALTSYHLHHMRTGSKTNTDRFVGSLLRLACQTAALPCVATAITGIIYCATFSTDLWWNFYNVTLPILPSLYVYSLIFCLSGQIKSRAQHEQAKHQPQHLKVDGGLSSNWHAPREWAAERVVPILAKEDSSTSDSEKTNSLSVVELQGINMLNIVMQAQAGQHRFRNIDEPEQEV